MWKNIYVKILLSVLTVFVLFQALVALEPTIHKSFYKKSPFELALEAKDTTDLFRVQDGIAIPIRQGFPFCETFIGYDPRPNAIWGGTYMNGTTNPNVKLVGDALQLTSAGQNENGYVYVDIPFSSAYGLKVSFEFASFGGRAGFDGRSADGFTFFMYDGAITQSEFDIGGTGGALGYTAVRQRFSEATLVREGLRGAYLGVGFDELGNFGNAFYGKNGGFENPNNDPDPPGRPTFSHSVVIRGPVDGAAGTPFKDRDRINESKNIPGTIVEPRWDSYKFIDGVIFDPNPSIAVNGYIESTYPQYFHSTERFELDSDTFADECSDEGYRKVFIDLNPIDVNDRSQGYTLEVQMLINDGGVVKLVNVFEGPVNYPFGAPEQLKVGFAAATGDGTNFHWIRNVTVQVSNEDELEKPIVGPLIEEVCEGETSAFELDVELRNDAANAFIRCLQLYYTEQEAYDVISANNSSIPFPPSANENELCLTGNCVDLLCSPDRISRPAYDNVSGELAGQFEVYLTLEGGVEVPRVRFVPEDGYSGETTIYYTATDNFGQVSDPKPITITIFPQPDPIVSTEDPLVWELQEAGDISVLLTSDVTDPTYSYQWYRNGSPISGANSITYTATQEGEYQLEVSTPNGCIGISQEAITIELVENLNPRVGNSIKPETCAELGSGTVTLDDFAVSGVASDGSAGNEKWRIVDAAGNVVQDWTFMSPGQTSVDFTDLPAGSYVFQIGDEYRSGQNGSDGQPLYRHELPFEILPIQDPLRFESIEVLPELCFEEGGSITVTGAGGDGISTYDFEIINQASGQTVSPTSVSGATAIFDAVPQGSYDVILKSGTRCEVISSEQIVGPSSPLDINLLESEDVTCGQSNNGTVSWGVSGGTEPYQFVRLEQNGSSISSPNLVQNTGEFVFSELTSGSFVLVVQDSNGCEIISEPVDLIDQPFPVYEIHDVAICEGETALLEIDVVETGNATPEFLWYNSEGTPISGSGVINGITYQLISNGDPTLPPVLEISGLSGGDHVYTLQITGENTCNQEPKEIVITVTPYPEIKEIFTEDLSCFQAGDGTIEIVLAEGLNPTDYLFEIEGIVAAQESPIITGLSAGTYEVLVINKISQCSVESVPVEIQEPSILELVNIELQNPTCRLDNGGLKFEIAGGTPNYSITINDQLISDFSFTNSGEVYEVLDLAPGDYIIEIEDANGCILSSSAQILTNDPLDPLEVEGLGAEVCFGDEVLLVPEVTTPRDFEITWFSDPDGANVLVSGSGSQGETYELNSGNGSLVIQGLPEGEFTYFYQVTGPFLCPSELFEVHVSIYPELVMNLEVSNEICFESSNGIIQVEAGGGNGEYLYSLDGVDFGPNDIFNGLEPGNYTVYVQTTNGCAIQQEVEVLGPAGPIQINSPDMIRSSCGLANGSFENLEITGGWGEYSVTWTQGSPSGNVVAGNLTGVYDLLPGLYYLTVVDSAGCLEIFEFELESSSDPEYQLVPVSEICIGESVEFRPIHLAPDPSLPPVAFTEVKWFASSGMQDEIQNGPDPTNPDITYSIDNSDWLNPKLEVTGLPVGTHDFYFYIECTGVELTTEVKVLPIPEVKFDLLSVSCFDAQDGKIIVSEGGDDNFLYSINGGPEMNQSALEALDLAPGTYSIVVTQSGVGCPSESKDLIIERPELALAIENIETKDPGCGVANGEVTGKVVGGWADYSIQLILDGNVIQTLSSSEGSFTFGSLVPGDYSILVEDNRGCNVSEDLVTLVPGPTRIDVDDLEICEGEVAVLTPTLEPPAPGAQITWFKDSGKSDIIVSSTTPDSDGYIYTISATGVLTIEGLSYSDTPYTYYADVTGADICPGFTAEPQVKVNQPPVPQFEVVDAACFGENGIITLTAIAGNGSFEFSLDGQNYSQSGEFEVGPGTYTAYVRSGGCERIVSDIQVNGPASELEIKMADLSNPQCNTSNGELEFEVNGGYGPVYQYRLLKDGDVVENGVAASNQLLFFDLGPGEYQVEVTDGSCFVSSEKIILDPVFTPVSAIPAVVCEGEVVVLVPQTTQVGVSPIWHWYKDPEGTEEITSGVVDGDVSYSIDANGTLTITGLKGQSDSYLYYLGVDGENICPPELLPVSATVHDIPNLRVSNPSIVCDPTQTVDLTQFIEGFNPSLYDYQIENPNGTPMRIDEIDEVQITGDYKVSNSLKGKNCWSQTQRIKVIISDTELIPNFDYSADLGGGIMIDNQQAQIFEDVVFADISQGKIIVWNWDFGDGNQSSNQNPVHQYQEKGVYTVTLTTIDEFGCIAEYQEIIEVKDDYLVIVPNAFTPDGVKNLYFKPAFRGIVKMEFYIFNTWGELIFESQDLEGLGWDGTLKGVKAPNGNYVYKGLFWSASGEKVEKSGVFTLIR